jgi:hypothetical protein
MFLVGLRTLHPTKLTIFGCNKFSTGYKKRKKNKYLFTSKNMESKENEQKIPIIHVETLPGAIVNAFANVNFKQDPLIKIAHIQRLNGQGLYVVITGIDRVNSKVTLQKMKLDSYYIGKDQVGDFDKAFRDKYEWSTCDNLTNVNLTGTQVLEMLNTYDTERGKLDRDVYECYIGKKTTLETQPDIIAQYETAITIGGNVTIGGYEYSITDTKIPGLYVRISVTDETRVKLLWRVKVSERPFHYANIILKRMDIPDKNVYKVRPELMVKLGKAWLEVSESLKIDDPLSVESSLDVVSLKVHDPLSVESSADVVSFFKNLFLQYNSDTIIIQFPTHTLPRSSNKWVKNN